MLNTHVVIYRTGGTENFEWHRTVLMSREEANRVRADLERQGYRAMTENAVLSYSIGLPDTFEYTN